MEKPAAAAQPVKIPAMQKDEYDAMIRRGILARIAFSGADHPYITLQGKLAEVTDAEKMREIRSMFAERIAGKTVSANSLAALGYRPSDDPGKLVEEDRTMVWKLIAVRDIVALKES